LYHLKQSNLKSFIKLIKEFLKTLQKKPKVFHKLSEVMIIILFEVMNIFIYKLRLKPNMKRLAITLILLLLITTLIFGCTKSNTNPGDNACTTDAKVCPDGSSVGREGSNCEFAACPLGSMAPPALPEE